MKISFKRIFKKLLPYFIGIFLGAILSFIFAIMVEETSDESFCGSCHTMKPMVESFLQSKHGGNNKLGIKAKCVDCHLPHNNLLNYLFRKGTTGFHDVWAQMFYSNFEWEKNRDNREKYVYDSGCLKCHKNIEHVRFGNLKSFIAHKAYFLTPEKYSCVMCHKNVGHKDLGLYLKKYQEKGEK
ncbi:NapC/NirT family cytochrome c [bacterium]|nr:NapC/NirT family cytochrome c [bacterium]